MEGGKAQLPVPASPPVPVVAPPVPVVEDAPLPVVEVSVDDEDDDPPLPVVVCVAEEPHAGSADATRIADRGSSVEGERVMEPPASHGRPEAGSASRGFSGRRAPSRGASAGAS